MTWSGELVRRYIASCDDVVELHNWISLCHQRRAALGAKTTTISLVRSIRLGEFRYDLVGYRWVFPLDEGRSETVTLYLEKQRHD